MPQSPKVLQLTDMRDLNQAVSECIRELDALRVPYNKNVRFTVNTRAISRLGFCRKNGSDYVIEIAAILLDDRVDYKLGLKNTIHHELLHTCRGCMNHTGKWAQLADRVNSAYGYRISRLSSPSEGIIPPDLLPQPRYILRCVSCGSQINRQKQSAAVLHPERYRCASCGGRLERLK